MENSIFKSLTCGVTFKKPKAKLEAPTFVKKDEKIDFDDEVFVNQPPKKRKKLTEAFLRQKEIEDTTKLRKQHHINVKGSVEKIKPVQTFFELFERYPMNQKLIDNIMSFKYSQPTAVQMQVLPIFLEGKAVKCVAPTGSGIIVQE